MAQVTGLEARKKDRDQFQLVFNSQADVRTYDVFISGVFYTSINSFNSFIATEAGVDKILSTISGLNPDQVYSVTVAAVIGGQRDTTSAILAVDMTSPMANVAFVRNNPIITAMTLTSSTSIYQVTLPNPCRGFVIKPRLTTGNFKVGLTTLTTTITVYTNYWTVLATIPLDTGSCYLSGYYLNLQSSATSGAFELLTWS